MKKNLCPQLIAIIAFALACMACGPKTPEPKNVETASEKYIESIRQDALSTEKPPCVNTYIVATGEIICK